MELALATVRLPAQLDADTVAALSRDLSDAVRSSARIVVVTGATDDTFCLGLALGSPLEGEPATHAFAALLAAMHECEKPLLAVVDGRAIGGGMGIASACDWMVATERASFALPELLWGLLPAIIWPVIADRMAPHTARQWTLSGHARTAREAAAAGLVDEVVESDRLDQATSRAARMLARLDPTALCRFRAWLRASRRHDLPEALRMGAQITAEMIGQPGVRNRWQAFADGGAPWSA